MGYNGIYHGTVIPFVKVVQWVSSGASAAQQAAMFALWNVAGGRGEVGRPGQGAGEDDVHM